MQELENRVTRVEWTIEHHAELLDSLKQSSDDFHESLQDIRSTLSQIKYFAAGALALYFADHLGLANALKLIGV